MGNLPLSYSSLWGNVILKLIQAIAVAYGCFTEFQGKILLQKTRRAVGTRFEGNELEIIWKPVP